jgi:hypothetical protein
VWLSIENVRAVIQENKHSNQGFVLVGTDKLGGENIWIGDDGVWVFSVFEDAHRTSMSVRSEIMKVFVKPIMELEV